MFGSSNFPTIGVLSILLFFGGLLVAVRLVRREWRRHVDPRELTKRIAARSWSTTYLVFLFTLLLLLYGLVGCSGQFFYEEQLPAMRLVFTFITFSILVGAMMLFSRRQWPGPACFPSLGLTDVCKLRLAPVIYLAAIPFIMLASKVYQEMLQLVTGAETELQEVARMISGGHSPLEILYMLMAVFVAPFYEELLFRGVLFPYCLKRAGLAPAILLVSLFFGMMHFHLPSFLPLAMLSAVLCAAYWRTGSLWPSIGVHMIFNAATILALNLGR